MSDPGRPIAEEELHAYVDDQLDAGSPAGGAALPAGPSGRRAAGGRVARPARRAAGGVRSRGGGADPAAARPGAAGPGSGWRSGGCPGARRPRCCWRSAWAAPAAGSCTAASEPTGRAHAAGAAGGGQPRGLHRRPAAPDRTRRPAARRPGALGVEPAEPSGGAAGPVGRRLQLHGRPAGRDAGRAGRPVHVRRSAGRAAHGVRAAAARRGKPADPAHRLRPCRWLRLDRQGCRLHRGGQAAADGTAAPRRDGARAVSAVPAEGSMDR